MRRTLPLSFWNTYIRSQNLIQIQHGTFFRQHPAVQEKDSSTNLPLFSDLTFELPATTEEQARTPRISPHWAIIGSHGATTLLEILRGIHICIPPNARTFPYLSSDEIDRKDHRLRVPYRAIQYVGFSAGRGQGFSSGVRGAYLSARYESRREDTDWTLMQYLKGQTSLNPPEEKEGKHEDDVLLRQVIKDLRLERLVAMPVSNLSNGQTRRARIARALLGKPELLLLDQPFMGLDPPTLVSLSPMLRDLAYQSSPLLLLALRPQDPIPEWITHLVVLGSNNNVALMGLKAQVLFSLSRWVDMYDTEVSRNWASQMAAKMTEAYGPPPREVGHVLTSAGIERYDAYDRAKSGQNGKCFGERGEINSRMLSPENVRKVTAALSRSEGERTLEDWLVITSSVPKMFENQFDAHPSPGIEDSSNNISSSLRSPDENLRDHELPARELGEPLIELSSIVIKYGDRTVLGHPPPQLGFSKAGLNLTIRRGTRLAILGPNGSGKTTLLSLLTSDHPQSYALPIRFFGRTRLPQLGKPGLSLWEIQSRIGHSSPELHGFFPKHLSLRQVLESAWAETYGAKPSLTYDRDQKVDAVLRWWEPELRQFRAVPDTFEETNSIEDLEEVSEEGIYATQMLEERGRLHAIWTMIQQSYPPIVGAGVRTASEPSPLSEEKEDSLDWADDVRNHAFGVLPIGTQRLLLLLRALIREPDIILLDEAFSGFNPEEREKAMCWLEHGEMWYPCLQKLLPRDVHEKFANAFANAGGNPSASPQTASLDQEFDTNSQQSVQRRVGRPVGSIKRYGLRRPAPVPGRAPGRPKGSRGFPPGTSPWVPAAVRSTIMVDAHNRPLGPMQLEGLRIPNMRHIVEAVCTRFGLKLCDLAEKKRGLNGTWVWKPGRRLRSCEAWKMSRSELETLASAVQQQKGPTASYRNTGLNDRQALIAVSHVREEVPAVVDEWIRLPGEEEVTEFARPVEIGRCRPGWIGTLEGWNQIWATARP